MQIPAKGEKCLTVIPLISVGAFEGKNNKNVKKKKKIARTNPFLISTQFDYGAIY